MPDNPNAFKHWIGPPLLARLATAIASSQPGLPVRTLTALGRELEPLELKDRVRLVRQTLHEILPKRYPQALAILVKTARSPALKGFDLWPITEFVQTYGVDDFDRSMKALHFLTQRFTAEFAVRPFLARDRKRTFAILERWAGDPSPHVRRCASEGTRPRLPWGERVTSLIEDPAPGLELLEALRFDPEVYVRRSVANHLNDISKDHPQLVLDTLRRWQRDCPDDQAANLDWIVRRALRGLIKQGTPGALALIGVNGKADVRARALALEKSRLRVGDTLAFTVTLASTSETPQKLVVDYIIHFVKANGGESAKVFKLKTFELPGRGRVVLTKRHSLRPITTRVYYPGAHRLAIQVNGTIVLEKRWRLDTR